MVAGPFCAVLLADLGADVIKIEHPRHGDGQRKLEPIKDGIALWWKSIGRNKRCITLDLGKPQGAEVFKDLVRGPGRGRRELPARHVRAVGNRLRRSQVRQSRSRAVAGIGVRTDWPVPEPAGFRPGRGSGRRPHEPHRRGGRSADVARLSPRGSDFGTVRCDVGDGGPLPPRPSWRRGTDHRSRAVRGGVPPARFRRHPVRPARYRPPAHRQPDSLRRAELHLSDP